jgi:two-component system, NtrC family, nitrogen regulation sensor histidine kinase NtrY
MVSRKIYSNIIIMVSVIVLFSLLLGYFAFQELSVKYSLVCLSAIIILAVNLISYLNRTNKNISFFFDSIRNDDSHFTYPTAGGTLSELHERMNKVNQQIRTLKLSNVQQEKYFQKILELLATGIITYDKKGFIHHANSAAKKLLSQDVLTHLQQLEKTDKKLYPLIRNLDPFERRLIALNTDKGEIQLSLKSTSFGTAENELTILSINDIKNELDEKEIDSWMSLIRVLMHEIMNSITPITSLSDSLSNIYKSGEQTIGPEDVTENTIATTLQGLNVIRDQGKGLMSFVESYRKLTHLPKPEMKLFRAVALFSRVKILTDSLEKRDNTEIDFIPENDDLELHADENLVSLVLINLIKNAVEANEDNPTAKIKITAGYSSSNSPEICVSDNGPGISRENLRQIFVPFFTTRQKGSGIGLSISKQIMAAHGGTLKVSSVPGKVTVFCMCFRN